MSNWANRAVFTTIGTIVGDSIDAEATSTPTPQQYRRTLRSLGMDLPPFRFYPGGFYYYG